MKSILIVGNPCDGFRFYGPVSHAGDAADLVEQVTDPGEAWWVADLNPPEGEELDEELP